MADENFSVGFESAAFERGIEAATRYMTKMNEVIETVGVRFANFNERGRVTDQTLEILTESGRKFTLVAEQLHQKMAKVTSAKFTGLQQSLKQMAEEAEKAAAELEKVTANAEAAEKAAKKSAAARKGQATRFIREDIPALMGGEIPSKAEYPEVSTIEKARNTLAGMIRDNEASRTKIKQIIATIKNDSRATFEGLDAEIARHVRRILGALDTINNRVERNAERTKKRTLGEKEAALFASVNIPKIAAGIPKGATLAEVAGIEKTIALMSKALRTSEITRDQLHRVMIAIIKDNNAVFSDADAKAADLARRLLNRFQNIQKRLKAESSKTATAAIRMTEAQTFVGSDLQRMFPQIQKYLSDPKMDPTRIQGLQNAVNSAFRLIQGQSGVTREHFEKAFLSMLARSNQVFTGVEGKAQSALLNIRREVDQLSPSFKRVAQNVILSWTGVFRLFAVQVLHTAIRSIFWSSTQAIQKLTELKVKIAEVEAVSFSASMTTDRWTTSLRELSDAFGLDIMDVAQGAYETLSNEIADGADALRFMGESAKFARATNTSLTDTILLGSAALNAYRKEGLSTTEVYAKLFETIRIGRVTATQLAQEMGNVLVPAQQVGMKIEEALGAIAVLTQKGISPHIGQTLVKNVILALQKPSTEFQAVLREWGVETGEQAVRAFGFSGILKRLQDEYKKGGAARLAQIGQDIRKIVGLQGLSADAEYTAEKFKKIGGSLETYQRAVAIGMESYGTRLQQQAQQFKNVFTVDVAGDALPKVVQLLEKLGGTKNIILTLLEPFREIINNITGMIKGFYDLGQIVGSVFGGIGKILHDHINLMRVLSPLLSTVVVTWSTYKVAMATVTTAKFAYQAILNTTIAAEYRENIALAQNAIATATAAGNTEALAAAKMQLAAAEKAATASSSGFALSLGGALGIGLMVGTLVYSIMTEWSNSIEDAARKSAESFEEAAKRINNTKFTEAEEKIDALSKSFNDQQDKINKDLLPQFAEIQKLLDAIGVRYANTKASIDEGLGFNTDQIRNDLGIIKKAFSDPIKIIEELLKEIDKSKERVREYKKDIMELNISEAGFGLNKSEGFIEQTKVITDIISDLEGKAQVALFDNSNSEQYVTLLKEIEDYYDRLLSKNPSKTLRDTIDEINKTIDERKIGNLSTGEQNEIYLKKVEENRKAAEKLLQQPIPNLQGAVALFKDSQDLLKKIDQSYQTSNQKAKSKGLKTYESPFGAQMELWVQMLQKYQPAIDELERWRKEGLIQAEKGEFQQPRIESAEKLTKIAKARAENEENVKKFHDKSQEVSDDLSNLTEKQNEYQKTIQESRNTISKTIKEISLSMIHVPTKEYPAPVGLGTKIPFSPEQQKLADFKKEVLKYQDLTKKIEETASEIEKAKLEKVRNDILSNIIKTIPTKPGGSNEEKDKKYLTEDAKSDFLKTIKTLQQTQIEFIKSKEEESKLLEEQTKLREMGKTLLEQSQQIKKDLEAAVPNVFKGFSDGIFETKNKLDDATNSADQFNNALKNMDIQLQNKVSFIPQVQPIQSEFRNNPNQNTVNVGDIVLNIEGNADEDRMYSRIVRRLQTDIRIGQVRFDRTANSVMNA